MSSAQCGFIAFSTVKQRIVFLLWGTYWTSAEFARHPICRYRQHLQCQGNLELKDNTMVAYSINNITDAFLHFSIPHSRVETRHWNIHLMLQATRLLLSALRQTVHYTAKKSESLINMGWEFHNSTAQNHPTNLHEPRQTHSSWHQQNLFFFLIYVQGSRPVLRDVNRTQNLISF